MAIVEMKHVDMLALEGDRQALLAAIQKMGCFQLTPADTEDVTFNKPPAMAELTSLDDTITRVGWAIAKLNRFDTEKKPLMADKPAIDSEQAAALLAAQPTLMQAVEALEALERETGDLRGLAARLDAQREQMLPWRGLPLPLDEVHSTRNTVTTLGTVQKAALEQWQTNSRIGELCSVETVSTQRELAYVYILCHRDAWAPLQALLKEGGYTPVLLPRQPQTADEMLAALADERRAVDESQQTVLAKVAAYADRLNDLRMLHDILTSRRERLLAARSVSVSERTFFLQGWVPAHMTERIQRRLKAVSPSVALTFYDAAEGEEPPVMLHNATAVSPFENVVSSFSMPAPYSIDPTAVMMPFFINFMGMMVSDAGYGLVMAILSPILIRIFKPAKGMQRMLWIIFGGGVMTVFWGAMYNSWFGYAPWPLFLDPMNNALPVMALCIGLGALHLFAGLGMAAYLNIRRRQYLDVVFDQLSWFMLMVGLGLLAVVPSVGQWLAIAGAGIIVLTAGRAKSKNPLKRLISGLGALYGVTSWVSDLLSYIRLFGMGLATGVIGMVINILVGMVAGGGGVFGIIMGALVFVGGHLFNAGINVFGAYVHSCRLQYIEFFGKFFEDGGRPFKPLTETARYVYIRDANAQP
jgi:V/A-type H+-transporting ATPase subunit I